MESSPAKKMHWELRKYFGWKAILEAIFFAAQFIDVSSSEFSVNGISTSGKK